MNNAKLEGRGDGGRGSGGDGAIHGPTTVCAEVQAGLAVTPCLRRGGVQGLGNQRPLSFVKPCKALEFLNSASHTGQRGKLQASKRQQPEKLQAPKGRRGPGRRATWLKNMKLRNEPILKMQESPDFTDMKWRF